jgi:hypothetical protein
MPIPGELAVFEKVLGKPSSAIDDPLSQSHKYVLWNELGIRGRYDEAGKQDVRELEFYFGPSWDLKPFPGELVLEGQRITKATNVAELSQKINILRKMIGDWWSINYLEHPLCVDIIHGGDGASIVWALQPGLRRE